MKKEELNKFYMEVNMENQKFLNKAIFAFSMLAIPFLLEALLNNQFVSFTKCMLSVALVGFVLVIIIQIFSIKAALWGCNNYFGSSDKEKEEKNFFVLAIWLNRIREGIFIISTVIIMMSYLTIPNQEIRMSDDKKKQAQEGSVVIPKAVKKDKETVIESFTALPNQKLDKEPQEKPPEEEPKED